MVIIKIAGIIDVDVWPRSGTGRSRLTSPIRIVQSQDHDPAPLTHLPYSTLSLPSHPDQKRQVEKGSYAGVCVDFVNECVSPKVSACKRKRAQD